MKCTIQWLNADGEPTPDDNIAVAVVYCTDELCKGSSKKFPICEQHLLNVKYYHNWIVVPLNTGDCKNGDYTHLQFSKCLDSEDNLPY
jgi:hypothetical protein